MNRANAVAVAWVIAYCSLVVFVCGALAQLDVAPQIVVPIGLFVLPFLACVPPMVWQWYKKSSFRD